MSNHHVEVLRQALAHPDLQPESPHFGQAALDLAVALGWCRLTKAQVSPNLDGTLPSDVALAAVRRLSEQIEDCIVDLETLEARWTDASPIEQDDIACTPLEFRMDAWAAQVALREVENVEGIDHLQIAFTLGQFDGALRAQIDTLCTIVDLPLLDNWRGTLTEPFLSQLPWWLDGTLEKRAAEMAAELNGCLPSAEHWKKLAEGERND
jgi:hypothetical protein